MHVQQLIMQHFQKRTSLPREESIQASNHTYWSLKRPQVPQLQSIITWGGVRTIYYINEKHYKDIIIPKIGEIAYNNNNYNYVSSQNY